MLEIHVAAYDDPDPVALTAEVQQEYVLRYGEPDVTPTDPREFVPPDGLFLVAYLDGGPVAMGGWRVREPDGEVLRAGDVEIKRMYVVRAARGRGLSRIMLAELERTAFAAGHRRIVLETGMKQPEAISLYESSGYRAIGGYGAYKDDELSRYFAKPLPARESPSQARESPFPACEFRVHG